MLKEPLSVYHAQESLKPFITKRIGYAVNAKDYETVLTMLDTKQAIYFVGIGFMLVIYGYNTFTTKKEFDILLKKIEQIENKLDKVIYEKI